MCVGSPVSCVANAARSQYSLSDGFRSLPASNSLYAVVENPKTYFRFNSNGAV